jgi:hypothetical protein
MGILIFFKPWSNSANTFKRVYTYWYISKWYVSKRYNYKSIHFKMIHYTTVLEKTVRGRKPYSYKTVHVSTWYTTTKRYVRTLHYHNSTVLLLFKFVHSLKFQIKF